MMIVSLIITNEIFLLLIVKELYVQNAMKVRVGNGKEMGQSEGNSHSKNRGEKETRLKIRYFY